MDDGSERTPRRRRVRWIVPLAVAGALAAFGVAVAIDANTTRAALSAAGAHAKAAREALLDADLERTRTELDAASADLTRAHARTHDPVWGVFSGVPALGRSGDVVRALVECADATVATARAALSALEGAVGADGRLVIRRSDGSLDVAAITSIERELQRIDVGRLRAATSQLGATRATWIPAYLRVARQQVAQIGDDLATLIENVRGAVGPMLDFLGATETRRYFVAMENSAELRGTGGLVNFFAVMTARSGRFTLSVPEQYSKAAGERIDPVPLDAEFERRYGHVNPGGQFLNVNVDPNLPTTAPVMLAQHEARTGQRLDGIIMMDAIGLALVLDPIGSIDLPDELKLLSLPDDVRSSELARVALVDAYEAFGGESPQRDAYLSALASTAFARILGADWDATVVRSVGRAAAGRHIQLYSVISEEQAAFEAMGIAGVLAVPDDTDLLAVTANNAGPNKSDVHVAHALTAQIALSLDTSADGTTIVERTADVTVSVENPLPTSGMSDVIIGSANLPATPDAQLNGPRGLNRTWFTLWAPGDTAVLAIDGDGPELLSRWTGSFRGFTTGDAYVETPSSSTAGARYQLDGPVPITRDGPDLIYRLALWRQSKAVPDQVDITIRAPDGWGVAGARASDPVGVRGIPVSDRYPAELKPVTVTSTPDTVQVTGSVGGDLRIEIRFSRGLFVRARDWLDDPV